ncbi:MAG TPA: hypothetical protein VMX96_02945 [Dehalococcoidia bacterium]|nr:hypothetical protein [Dehalococcoidia bacterium]
MASFLLGKLSGVSAIACSTVLLSSPGKNPNRLKNSRKEFNGWNGYWVGKQID